MKRTKMKTLAGLWIDDPDKLDVRFTRFETSDKMTERQILQKVRRHYVPSGATPPRSGRSRP